MKTKGPRSSIAAHYDGVSDVYGSQYDPARLEDLRLEYPADYFRLRMLTTSFLEKGVRRVIEVGVGEGTPLSVLAKAGMEVWGFDISDEMLKRSQARLKDCGVPQGRVFRGDIQDPMSYAHALRGGPFDGLMAMGVMPHVRNDEFVLRNMASLVRPGGTLFVEFRNKLFSLFTFNRNTHDFILDDLLAGVSPALKDRISQDLRSRLRMDRPPVRKNVGDSDAPGYDAILSRFHNPFEVLDLFKRLGFASPRLRWYHYHPAMPYLAEKDPAAFRREAVLLEHETSGWRGLFLCSAFVVEAEKAV